MVSQACQAQQQLLCPGLKVALSISWGCAELIWSMDMLPNSCWCSFCTHLDHLGGQDPNLVCRMGQENSVEMHKGNLRTLVSCCHLILSLLMNAAVSRRSLSVWNLFFILWSPLIYFLQKLLMTDATFLAPEVVTIKHNALQYVMKYEIWNSHTVSLF